MELDKDHTNNRFNPVSATDDIVFKMAFADDRSMFSQRLLRQEVELCNYLIDLLEDIL